MPKIKGSLADISTEYQMIEPDVYEMKVEKIDVEETPSSPDRPSGQLAYIVTSRVDMPGADHHNKPVRDYIYWYKKDGDVNEYSQAQLKRYFEAIAGEERANESDLDTDELLGGRFQSQVTIETYKKDDGSEGQSNKLKNVSSL